MDNRKFYSHRLNINSFVSPVENTIKSLISKRIKNIRDDIIIGEIIYSPIKIRNHSSKKNESAIPEEYSNKGINDQIVKNMQKAFKISLANTQRQKLVRFFKYRKRSYKLSTQ